MAKKKKLELEDYQFDRGLDLPDMDFNLPPPADNRKPATKLASGIKSGAKTAVTSPAFIQTIVKNALPRGYGSALELAGQSAKSLKDLYNSTGKDIKPVLNELKKTTTRLAPTLDKVLPKSLAQKMKTWAATVDVPAKPGIDPREAVISNTLADMMKTQMVEEAKRNSNDDIKVEIRENIEQIRHSDSLGQLSSIRDSLIQLANYQTNIGSNFQRKSLELQFRQYFIAVDAFEEQKKQGAVVENKLEGILKNTGLPEYVKLKTSERFGEAMRNKFLDNLNEGFFDKRRNFVKNLGAGISKSVKSSVGGFTSNLGQALSMGNQAMDANEAMRQAGGPGIDRYDVAGNLIGDFAVNSMGARLGRKINPILERSPWIMKGNNKARHLAGNAQQYANEFANGEKGENWMGGGLVRGFKNVIKGLNGQDNTIHTDGMQSLQEPMPFSRLASKSLTEIIPGWLSMIRDEVHMLRTGNNKAESMSYDLTKNKFNTSSDTKKNAFKAIVSDQNKKYTTEDINSLIDRVDPNKTLDAGKRKILGDKMLHDNMNNRLASKKRLSEHRTFVGGETDPHAEEFVKLFREYFKNDKLGSKEQAFSAKFGNLGRYIGDSRRGIQDQANNGMTEYLKEAGLLGVDGKTIDMKRLQQYYFDQEYNPASPAPAPANAPLDVNPSDPSKRKYKVKRAPVIPTPLPPANLQNPPVIPTINPTPAPLPVLQQQQRQPPPPPPQVMFDSREIIATIKEQSPKIISQLMSSTLLRIEKKLKEGIITYAINMNGGGNGPGPGPSPIPPGPDPSPDPRPNRWWKRSLGSNIGSVLSGGAKAIGYGARGMNKLTNAAWNTAGNTSIGIVKGVASVGRFALGKLDKSIDKMKGIADVFVQGEAIPRLEAAKLKAGEYTDQATGKVIKSYKDIKGGVLDAAGKLVLTVDELKKVDIRSTLGEKIGDGLKNLAGIGADAIGAVRKVLPGVYGAGVNLIGKVGMAAIDKLDGPVDTYVKGDLSEPRLTKRLMQQGGYFSKKSKKPIKKFSDVDGPVVDADGDVVLTQQDIKRGLVDKNGKPITSGLGKIANLGRAGMDMIRNGVGSIGSMIGGVGKGISGLFSKFIGKDGFMFAGSKKIVDHLLEIRNLLDERLPGKKKVLGDIDGDGVRENSVVDLQRKKKVKAEKEETKKNSVDAAKAGSSMGMLGGLRSMFEKMSKKKEEEKQEAEGIGAKDLLNAGAEALPPGEEKKKKRRNRGRGRGGPPVPPQVPGGGPPRPPVPPRPPGPAPRRGVGNALWRGTKAVAKGGWGAAKWAGRTALGLAGLGSLAGAASTAMAVGGAVLSGAGAVASGVLTGGIALLGGIASILASPVVLTGLAIAGIGAGLYYGYKAYTRNDMDTFSRVRYVQYGFDSAKPDFAGTVLGMEEKLKDAVIFVDGVAQLDEKKLDIKDLVKDFNVDIKKADEREKFVRWFALRFKPVFLVYRSALNKIKPGMPLDQAEKKLTALEKKQFMDIGKWPDGPYDEMVNPYPNQDTLPSGRKEVEAAVAEAMKVIDKEVKEVKPPEKKLEPSALEKSVAGASLAAGVLGTAKAKGLAGKDKAIGSVDDSKTLKDLAAAAGVAGGVGVAAGLTKVNDSGFANDRGMLYVSATASPMAQMSNGRLDALTAIRYKTYGLVEMEADKVRVLAQLETMVQLSVSYDTKKVASWKGAIDRIMAASSPAFGVEGIGADGAVDWISWFSKRFLPTYLNYASGVYAATGKDDPKIASLTLKPEDALTIALTIVGTNSEGEVVWMRPESPWPGYILNADVKSTDTNKQGLIDATKAVVLGQETSMGKEADKKNKAELDANGLPKVVTKPKTFWDNVFGEEATKTQNGSGIRGLVGRVFGAGPENQGAVARDQAIAAAGGNAISQPGNGTGGDINAIPMPTGSGSYASVKDLINGASKMVGVDEKLMATMAAVESGFNWNIKAAGSSATGLYQFIDGTWKGMLKKYGAKYGIDPNTPPTDPRANALMGAEYMKENAKALSSVKANLTDTDLYLAHFLGAGGAKQFLSADQSAIAANVMPGPARANQNIFYDKEGKPRTFAETYSEINRRIQSRGKQFGLGEGGGSEAIVAKSPIAASVPSSGSAPVAGGPPTPGTPGKSAGLGGGPPMPGAAPAPVVASPADTPVAPAATPSTAKGPTSGSSPSSSTPAPFIMPDSSGSGLAGPTPLKPKIPLPDMTPGLPAPALKTGKGGYAGSAMATVAPDDIIDSGFNSRSRIADAKAQSSVRNEAMNASIGSVDSTLQEANGIYREQLGVAKAILAAILGTASKTAQPQQPVDTTPAPQPKPQRKMPTAPVSMSKPF